MSVNSIMGALLKKEVLGRETLVAGGFEPFAVDVEDFDGHAARAGFGVRLEEDWLVGVARCKRVGARVCEKTLGEVGREAGGYGQGAFY